MVEWWFGVCYATVCYSFSKEPYRILLCLSAKDTACPAQFVERSREWSQTSCMSPCDRISLEGIPCRV